MKRRSTLLLAFRIGAVAALTFGVASTSRAAAQQWMDYFQPAPIISPLSSSCWGAAQVGQRDQSNGLEDEATKMRAPAAAAGSEAAEAHPPAPALEEPLDPGEPPAQRRGGTLVLLVAVKADPALHRRPQAEPVVPEGVRVRMARQGARGARVDRGQAPADRMRRLAASLGLSAAVPAMVERRVRTTRAAAVPAQSAQEGRIATTSSCFCLACVCWPGHARKGMMGWWRASARICFSASRRFTNRSSFELTDQEKGSPMSFGGGQFLVGLLAAPGGPAAPCSCIRKWSHARTTRPRWMQLRMCDPIFRFYALNREE
jgi:hypothetical protein